MKTDNKIIKQEAFFVSDDVKFFICSTKKMCLTRNKWGEQKTYMTIYFKKDAEIKVFDDVLLYGVDFINCKTFNST